jgi:predicted amidohydrolase
MDVIALQLDLAWESPAENLGAVQDALAAAPVAAGSLVVLPEMFATGFSMATSRTTEAPGGPTESALAGLARDYAVYLVAGLAVAVPGGAAANQAVGFGPDGAVAFRYTKLHPFSAAGEGEYYPAGDAVVTARLGGFTLAPFVCYDLRFPEVFRAAAAAGTDLFVVIANWPARRHDHWLLLARARAVENQAYVVAVNRCGSDPDHSYAGGTAVYGPHGETLAAAGSEPATVRAHLSPAAVADWRARFPALRDRRPTPPAVVGART